MTDAVSLIEHILDGLWAQTAVPSRKGDMSAAMMGSLARVSSLWGSRKSVSTARSFVAVNRLERPVPYCVAACPRFVGRS